MSFQHNLVQHNAFQVQMPGIPPVIPIFTPNISGGGGGFHKKRSLKERKHKRLEAIFDDVKETFEALTYVEPVVPEPRDPTIGEALIEPMTEQISGISKSDTTIAMMAAKIEMLTEQNLKLKNYIEELEIWLIGG
jgi:hypothetical protein